MITKKKEKKIPITRRDTSQEATDAIILLLYLAAAHRTDTDKDTTHSLLDKAQCVDHRLLVVLQAREIETGRERDRGATASTCSDRLLAVGLRVL